MLSLLAAIGALKLWRADLRVPFEYRGDALFYSSVIKSVVDHGWFWTNANMGAPDGLQLYDYPNVAHESFHLLVIKLMATFTGDWALLLNVYFLLGFPLITLSAMAVFRHFGVGWCAAIVGGVLYAFSPSRLLKGEGHLFLDVFYQVPLAVLLLLWVCSDAPPFWRAPSDPPTATRAWSRARLGRTAIALAIGVLGASTSAYYAFFTICLLVAAGIWGSIEHRSARQALAAALLIGTILLAMLANGLPSLIYHHQHGPNPQVGVRAAGEAEVHGMKIAQLLLPAQGHRIPALRRLNERYIATAPLLGENGLTSLGLVGGLGFLWLLGALVIRRRWAGSGVRAAPDRDPPRPPLTPPLSALNLGALLLGTIGGFGALIAVLVSPQIRAYSRLNVFIGFFALFAVVRLLDRLAFARPAAARWVLPLILAIGLFDQATAGAIRPYAEEQQAFASDRALVQRIEGTVSRGAMIFVLPYLTFPEGPSLQGMLSYDLLRPYLHSSTLRWSLPTMYGRGPDAVVRAIAAQPPVALCATLIARGFAGVLIHREGYADHGAAIEAGLRATLAAEPLVSGDGRLAFFALASR